MLLRPLSDTKTLTKGHEVDEFGYITVHSDNSYHVRIEQFPSQTSIVLNDNYRLAEWGTFIRLQQSLSGNICAVFYQGPDVDSLGVTSLI